MYLAWRKVQLSSNFYAAVVLASMVNLLGPSSTRRQKNSMLLFILRTRHLKPNNSFKADGFAAA